MQFVTTCDNAKLYFKDWGSGRPVILLHGWPLSSELHPGLPGHRAPAHGLRAVIK